MYVEIFSTKQRQVMYFCWITAKIRLKPKKLRTTLITSLHVSQIFLAHHRFLVIVAQNVITNLLCD